MSILRSETEEWGQGLGSDKVQRSNFQFPVAAESRKHQTLALQA